MDKNIYINYEAIDFAQEPSFIRYVKGSDAEAREFWEKWLADHPEKKTEIATARQMVRAIRVKEKPVQQSQLDRLWGKIDGEINREAKVRSITDRPATRRRWLGIAAAACIGLLLFFYLYNPNTNINVGSAEQLAYELPDGSKVTLNAGSEIVFNDKKWQNNRSLELKGEAFFEVTKGSRFQVQTAYGQVEVLGTSFNVYARPDAFAVDCFTGKVRVSTPKGAEQILTPGLGTELQGTGGLSGPTNFRPKETASWRQGEFYYEGAQLEQVFAELERQFDVEVQATEAIRNKVGTIHFDNSNLDSALYKITWPMGLEAKKQGRQIIIE